MTTNFRSLAEKKIIVITRIHARSSSSLAEVNSIDMFVKSIKSYASHVLICIDTGDTFKSSNTKYIEGVEEYLKSNNMADFVTILGISPWGKFTSALNAAVVRAADMGYELICFQVEYEKFFFFNS